MPEATRSPKGHASLHFVSRSMGPAEPSGASYVQPRERNYVQVQSRGRKQKRKSMQHSAVRPVTSFAPSRWQAFQQNLVQLLPLKAVREVEPCAGPSSELVDPRLPFTKNAKPPTSTSFACEGADRRALQ